MPHPTSSSRGYWLRGSIRSMPSSSLAMIDAGTVAAKVVNHSCEYIGFMALSYRRKIAALPRKI
jgi:hypothetical protein